MNSGRTVATAASGVTAAVLLAVGLAVPAAAGPSVGPGADVTATDTGLAAVRVPDQVDTMRTGAPPKGCARAQLAAAPLSNDPDRTPQGKPVRLTAMPDGSYVPVLMVHGWTSSATHTPARDGAFSARIDLTANRVGVKPVPRSLIGQLQGVGGTAVYTFDYHDVSGRWVTDSNIAPELGAAIECLYSEFDQRVIVVAHSMGGLATREALSARSGNGVPRPEQVSRVVTFGTPHTGSMLAAIAGGGLSRAPTQTAALLRLLLSTCGQRSAAKFESGSTCDVLQPAVRAFDGPAGRALRSGSPELQALRFPGVPFHALGGETEFRLSTPIGWFGLRGEVSKVPAGDLIVMPDSARHRATEHRMLRCEFELNPARVRNDFVLSQLVRVKAKSETRQISLNAGASACYHGNLMRSIELTNDALGIVADDVASRSPTRATDLLRAPVPSVCGLPEGILDAGVLDPIMPEAPDARTWINFEGDRIRQNDVAFGDVNGNAVDDAVVALNCNQGGVPWGQSLQFYTGATPTRLGGIDLYDINAEGLNAGDRAAVHDMTLEDGVAHVRWMSNREDDYGCCPTLSWEADFRWNGSKVVVENVQLHDEVATATSFLEDVLSGQVDPDVPVGIRVDIGASGVVSSQVDCYGSFSTSDWPLERLGPWVTDWFGFGSEAQVASRYCIVETKDPTTSGVLGMAVSGWNAWEPAWYVHPDIFW